MAGRGLHPMAQAHSWRVTQGPLKPVGPGQDPHFVEEDILAHKRCPACPEPPAGPRYKQAIRSPGRQELGPPGYTIYIPVAPKLGKHWVCGREAILSFFQAPLAVGTSTPIL